MSAVAIPASLPQLTRKFTEAEALMGWASGLRWRNGFRCPRCGHGTARQYSRGVMRCSGCRSKIAALSATAIGQYRGPHDALLLATWSIAEGGGMSASRLVDVAGIDYVSALLLLRKIRFGILYSQEQAAPFLDGLVEIDEAFIGGSKGNTGKRGRSPMPDKHLVLCAVERGQGGRCVMRRADRATKPTLVSFAERYVKKRSHLYSDGYVGYAGIDEHGYSHYPTVIDGGDMAAHEALPVVHQAISLCKRRMLATYNRQPDAEYLDSYLAEFCFSWNNRTLGVAERFVLLWQELLSAPLEVSR